MKSISTSNNGRWIYEQNISALKLPNGSISHREWGRVRRLIRCTTYEPEPAINRALYENYCAEGTAPVHYEKINSWEIFSLKRRTSLISSFLNFEFRSESEFKYCTTVFLCPSLIAFPSTSGCKIRYLVIFIHLCLFIYLFTLHIACAGEKCL